MSLKRKLEEEWLGEWMAFALTIPVGLALLAAAFMVLPERSLAIGLMRLTQSYPVRLDLDAVKATTLARDEARERERARQAELAAASSLTMPVQLPAEGNSVEEDDLSLVAGEDVTLADIDRAIGETESELEFSGDVMPITFDLAGGPNSANTIRVAKQVRDEDGVIGQIEVRIDNNSAIFVSRNDLLGFLPEGELATLSTQREFVPLSDLRDEGLALRYDPTRDLFVLRK